MNWITSWKKIGIKVKQIFKKQPVGEEETDWKNCPQCKKISYFPDLTAIPTSANVPTTLIVHQNSVWTTYSTQIMKL